MRKTFVLFILLILATISTPSLSAPAKQKKSAGISKTQAVKLITDMPEVKKFIANVKVAGKTRGVTSHIEYDRLEGGEHIIHVFELVPDDAETSHTATFNWYHVNAKTGKISKEF